VEKLVVEQDKKLILVNNKVDLIPQDLAEEWRNFYKKKGL
jgi:ribosome biogenesis GTPase A